MTTIWVDGDACPRPVKELLYKTSIQRNVPLILVSNSPMQMPHHSLIKLQLVGGEFDAADDYVADHANTSDLVITADILLAEKTVKKGVATLNPRGDLYTPDNIAERVTMRNLMAEMRTESQPLGGPPPYSPKDKQLFANSLDRTLTRLLQS